MQRNLEINESVNNWTVVSDPFIKDGRARRTLRCKCDKEYDFDDAYINSSMFSKSCRSCSQIERRNTDEKRVYNVGDVFMNLKILKIHSGKYISYTVECLNCGHVYHTGHSILNKKSKGDGLYCCHNCFNKDMKKMKRFVMVTEHISLSYYNRLNRQAKLRGIEFNLTPEYLESIFDGKCYLSGLDIEIGTLSNRDNNRNLGTASLDRLDSNQGYIVGNVKWTSPKINIMKNTTSVDDFINLCNCVTNYTQNTCRFKNK
jgi:hypothetical protein